MFLVRDVSTDNHFRIDVKDTKNTWSNLPGN